MNKTVIRVTPVGGFDIPELENWLAAMSKKGLRFSMTAGILTIFERTEQRIVQIHLEPIRGTAEDDPELNALYEDAGWQYWGIFRGSFYVFASDDLTAQAYTDIETHEYALKRFFKEKAIGGVLLVVANVLLLGLYQNGAPWKIGWTWLKCFPIETFSIKPVFPFLLSALGLLLIDLSYLLGLCYLLRYRKAVRNGKVPNRHRKVGWLSAVGLVILIPVFINTIQLFSGTDYRPYDLEGSGFITLTDIEGSDLQLSQNRLYNMDYIAHEGTLLDPESWYFRQCATFGEDDSPSDVPNLEITVKRYPLNMLAEMRVAELSRQKFDNSGDYQKFNVLDECLYAKREGWTHTSEITGETRTFLPGGILVLRRGNTVLFANYYGSQDLSEHIEHFAQMLVNL